MIILLGSKNFNDGHFLSRNIDTNFWTCVQAQSFLLNIFLLLSYTLHYSLLHRRTYSYICRSIHSPNQPHIESLTPSHFLPFTAWHAHSIIRPLNYSPSHSLSLTRWLIYPLNHFLTCSLPCHIIRSGGRLVYLIPTVLDFSPADLPKHPCLKFVRLCGQQLSTRHGRHAVLMIKYR